MTIDMEGPTPPPTAKYHVKSERDAVSRIDIIIVRFWDEVVEATELLDFAISSGHKTDDGRSVSPDIILKIKSMHQHMQEHGTEALPPTEMRAQFESAYFELSSLMTPITAITLRDTSDEKKYHIWALVAPGRASVANVWNRKMTVWTFLFISIAILQNVLEVAWGPTPDYASGEGASLFAAYLQIVLSILLPFAYGGIGACTYLLKSLHYFIHSRCFDRKREAEYYNRIILGIISGGTITLLVSQITTDGGEAITLSASALGFLAGYNTDFLFSAIERIANAVLPKVGIDTVKKAQAIAPRANVALSDVSFADLLQRYNAAETPEEKAMIASLIQKLSERI